jgi:hypothetical protein
MWRLNFLDKILAAVKEVIAKATGKVPPGSLEAELVLDVAAPETNLYLDGILAELLGRDSSFIVSYEGAEVTAIHKIVMSLIGANPVGEFKSDPAAEKSTYHKNDLFPAIQRGTWSGGDLWWDPYYIPADDPGDPGCTPGWIYFPRDADPVTLVPDLQDYMHSLLPDVVKDLQPLDRDEGWAYVQVPLNFTTAAASLVEVDATASVYDPDTDSTVWAEATAVPVSVVFDPGDGSDSVVCDVDEAKEAFDPTDPGNCAFTYLNSSNIAPGNVFKAALAVLWRGEFRSSSNSTLVTFPLEPTYIEIDVAVAEARPAVAVAD